MTQFTIPLLAQMKQFKYLTEPNAERYRAIMRFCFLNHMQYKNRLTKDEIYSFLKTLPNFSDYTEEMCEQDLKSLVDWGNLKSTQDTSKTATLQEFKNKRFLYELTSIGLRIERFLFELENSQETKAELNPKHIEKIYELLLKIDIVLKAPQEQAVDWWDELTGAFEEIERSYTEYISMLTSSEYESLMIKEKFLEYKSKLVHYLYNFHDMFQGYLPRIRTLFLNLPQFKVDELLMYIIQAEKEHPKNIFRDGGTIEGYIKSRWQNIKDWFVSPNGQAERLLEQIQQIIRKVSSYAARLSESSTLKVNRTEEYKHLARLFSNLDISECHKLSAVVFGVMCPKYITGDFPRATESTAISILDLPSFKVPLKSRGRLIREKIKVVPASEFSEEKKKRFEEYKKKIEEENELLQSLLKGNKIEFERLPRITPEVRKRLFVWLSRGLSSKVANTDSGKKFRVIRPQDDKRCILECTDGKMDMPAYVLEFVDE
ncbi:TIGR02677 family protein [Caldicellulosiruptor sp. DIB 104C]|uniref:TIGR02677 family protein n=1 Tax=Caldicellulosiruptor sp. DIB 104C TaxID=3019889 RepID=UPI002305926E|nr:TIGR02677 family protein [Caldicellulosiruptor sp. DIB 104C]